MSEAASASAAIASRLEQVFGEIEHTRMADVPILNKALSVASVGFRDIDDGCIGVLVTPWFMNLMLVPADETSWAELDPGTEVMQTLPSGDYEFIVGREDGIGTYQMCSLFSPMFEFADQATAIAAAEAAIDEAMTPPDDEKPVPKPLSRRDLLRGFAGGAR